jgi:membrane protease YdiL (CAAX protease family)
LGLRVFRPLEVSVILSKSGAISLVLFLGIIGAAGEELGWRGYLLPKLRESGVGRPFLLSGLVWALWHLPLVTLGGYYPGSHPAAIALSYTLSIIAIGTVIGEALLRTGRLGVAIALHAAHNFFFQLAVPRLVFSEAGPHARWWDFLGSDCGLLVALAYGTVTLSRCVRRSSR